MIRGTHSLLLNFLNGDTRFTVARATLKRLAAQLGLNETQVVHLALRLAG